MDDSKKRTIPARRGRTPRRRPAGRGRRSAQARGSTARAPPAVPPRVTACAPVVRGTAWGRGPAAAGSRLAADKPEWCPGTSRSHGNV